MTRNHNKNPRSERKVRHPAVPPEILTDEEAVRRLKQRLLVALEKQEAPHRKLRICQEEKLHIN